MEDPYLRERASDVEGLGKRVLGYLQQTSEQKKPLPKRIVLLGENLSAERFSPSNTMRFGSGFFCSLVCCK